MGLKELKEIDAKIVTQLREMNEYRVNNKIEFFCSPNRPSPNPIQKELLDAWDDPQYKTFTITGGNRIGKTSILSIIADCVMYGEFPWNHQKIHFSHSEPRKIRYVGQDWHNQIKAVVIPEFKKWWPKVRLVKTTGNGIIPDTTWRDVKTGSTLEIMSNKQEPAVFEGWSGDLLIYDEPPRREIYIANARGLVDRQGRELFGCTLLKEAWIHRDVINKKNEDGTPDRSVFSVDGDIYVNVGYGITEEGVEDFKNKLNADEEDARIKGIPGYMSGLVLPTYSRKLHLKTRFLVPLNWIVDIAIDAHPRENQAILFIGTAPDNKRYLINEIWDHGDGTWIGEQIVRMISQNAYRVGTIECDPLAKGDRNEENTTFDKIERVLMRHGHILETASKDKASGILEIKNHLIGPNKEPSLFIFDDLKRTIYEIEGWMYDEDTQKPQDKDDHFMENLYRLLLLNTQYTEPEEDGYEESSYAIGGRDAQTGY